MDVTTLMSLLGMAGPTGIATTKLTEATDPVAPTAATPGAGAAIPMPPYYPHGTPIVPPRGTEPATVPAAPAIPVKQGGFSTGNILKALLGSNFGQ